MANKLSRLPEGGQFPSQTQESRLTRSVRNIIGASLTATACAGSVQTAEDPSGKSAGICPTVECLQADGSQEVAYNTLMNDDEYLRNDTAAFALDMIPDDDLRLLALIDKMGRASSYKDESDSDRFNILCGPDGGYTCDVGDRDDFIEAVLHKIHSPQLALTLYEKYGDDDWFYFRLIDKIPDNHPVVVANLYRPQNERDEVAARKITDPELALELTHRDGIRDRVKRMWSM